MSTVTVRGEGGATFDMDEPAEGTMARERFDAMIARGELTIVEDDDKPKRRRGRDKPEPDADLDELDAWATAMVNDHQYEDRAAALAALHEGD